MSLRYDKPLYQNPENPSLYSEQPFTAAQRAGAWLRREATAVALASPDVAELRETAVAMREWSGMEPATFNYQDPTREMLNDPLWQAIWDEIKTWDIGVPTEYDGYSAAPGNHVTAIYLAIRNNREITSMYENAGAKVAR